VFSLGFFMLAGLGLIPSFDLTDVDHGLVGLGKDFARVADTDMDVMFQKVGSAFFASSLYEETGLI